MITFRDNFLWLGSEPVAWIYRPEIGHALIGQISLATELCKLSPTDESGVRLLQVMAREIEEKLTQPAQ